MAVALDLFKEAPSAADLLGGPEWRPLSVGTGPLEPRQLCWTTGHKGAEVLQSQAC